MAVELQGYDIGWLTASADLSAKQYFIVDISGDGTITTAGSAGQAVLGVLQNDPESGQVAIVRTSGVSKVKVGTGGLTAGQLVQADADGTAIAGASGDYVIGMALNTGAEGSLVAVAIGVPGGQIN